MTPPRRLRPLKIVARTRATRSLRAPFTALGLLVLGSLILLAAVLAERKPSPPRSPIEVSATQTESAFVAALPSDPRTPFPPFNEGDGPCHDAHFSIDPPPPADRVYHAGDTLSVTVRYDAQGCTKLTGTFGVRHLPGSPRYRYYCKDKTPPLADLDPCERGFDGNIPANKVDISTASGTATLIAQPGTFPPTELASVPDLEGAELCAVVVQASDGIEGGSWSFQQLDIACLDEFSIH